MIRRVLTLLIAGLTAVSFAACTSTKKPRKRDLVKLPGEEGSDMSWNRPTSASQVGSPLGMPTSR